MRNKASWLLATAACVLLAPSFVRGNGPASAQNSGQSNTQAPATRSAPPSSPQAQSQPSQSKLKPEFHTSDRCLACHNQITTVTGKDISIGTEWRATIMANSARDPYWQGSIRRETIDHPENTRDIEDECSACHMPVTRYEAKIKGDKGEVFNFLPFNEHHKDSGKAEDGVTCSVCHQITNKLLGQKESFSGEFVIDPPADKHNRPEYGPFDVNRAQQLIMDSSTGGFRPTEAKHIRESALCATCHQLYTTARGEGGKKIGTLAEQMPYLEYLHSDAPKTNTCQTCHMPEVKEPAQISSVLGPLRVGMRQHLFLGGNFFMEQMLNRYRDDLNVWALPNELTTAANDTVRFLQSEAARVEVRNMQVSGGRLQAEVFVQNLTGHKLPTAFPSRRAWLHLTVKDRDGKTVFESGKLNDDGSIVGNDNDADKSRFEPHYREITSADQVEIFEDILKDSQNHVTTGLLAAIGFLKDNRILPSGFEKATAETDIAVVGDAKDDPAFTGGGDTVRYNVPYGAASGPFHVEAELLYQPIGFRWAHNLAGYKAAEPQRFVSYYEADSRKTAIVLAAAEGKF